VSKKTFTVLILTVALLSIIFRTTLAWFYDVEISQPSVFQAGVWGQPRLWIWRHGAKVSPEWQVGDLNDTQVLYARIINEGNRSVYIKVEFIVTYLGRPIYRANSTAAKCDGIPPGNVTVSVEYHPTRPGTYYFKGKLWFSFHKTRWGLWSDFQEEFGGEGVSKTASSKFKVRG